MSSQPDLLVIGYGNTLRGDDGVGVRVAEAVAALQLPGVRALTCHQLAPEDAERVSQAARVVFVDAAAAGGSGLQVLTLAPDDTTQLMAHAADPRTVLALAREIFGHAPEAWALTIPAIQMGFSEELTPQARQGLDQAVAWIRELAATPS